MAENQQVLLMKYHPAKKEVQFRRYQNEKEVPIRSDSRLMPYMVKWKGKFVLQDHGKDLFDDIVKAFDSLQEVEMHVITTKLDYEDLEQMVEFYNNNSQDCKITTTLIAELPDMNKTFLAVKSFGEDAKEILRKHKKVIEKSPQDVEKVQESVIRFSSQLEEEIRNIDDKINSLEDNNVSLGKPELRFHDLRHSYAVLSLLTGANLKTLSSQLGHATVAFTLDVYGHTTDSMRKDAADRMCTYIQSVTGDEK